MKGRSFGVGRDWSGFLNEFSSNEGKSDGYPQPIRTIYVIRIESKSLGYMNEDKQRNTSLVYFLAPRALASFAMAPTPESIGVNAIQELIWGSLTT